jgi:colicin import membrane protein
VGRDVRWNDGIIYTYEPCSKAEEWEAKSIPVKFPNPCNLSTSMARRLKTYQTSSGFFDLAVAAPSMKAAAEAWGSGTNVFNRGFAKETNDPAIVAATMAKPGVVLRRPVGSNVTFTEHAELPKDLPVQKVKEGPAKPHREPPPRKTNANAARAAALAFEREHKRRELKRRKEEAAREKERKRRDEAIAKAERAFEQAEREHEVKIREIERDRAALDKLSEAENARWEKQREKLERALRSARD